MQGQVLFFFKASHSAADFASQEVIFDRANSRIGFARATTAC
jgi:hypothetical protein